MQIKGSTYGIYDTHQQHKKETSSYTSELIII